MGTTLTSTCLVTDQSMPSSTQQEEDDQEHEEKEDGMDVAATDPMVGKEDGIHVGADAMEAEAEEECMFPPESPVYRQHWKL